MGSAEEHRELILPLTVIVISAAFGLFSFLNRPPRMLPRTPIPVPASDDAKPATSPTPDHRQSGPESAQGAAETGAIPSETSVAERYIISDEDSTLYVVQETSLYACPDRECDIVDTLFPGIYWHLAYTLSPDGWFGTGVPQKDVSGYIAVSDLSANYPQLCHLVLPYRVGHVGARFLDEGFTRDDLVAFVRAAELQIEEVIGRNILSYEAEAPNTVNFVISHYKDNEPYHRGLLTSDAVFPNGAVGQFWIGIYAALFDDVQEWLDNGYIGPQHERTFKTNYMKKALLHEMGHTTGFDHVDDPTAVMCGAPDCRPAAVDFSHEQLLNEEDTQALRDWCGV